MSEPSPPPIFDNRQVAAERLGISVSSLDRYIKAGIFADAVLKVEGRILIDTPVAAQVLRQRSRNEALEKVQEEEKRKARQAAKVAEAQSLAFADEIEAQEREKIMGKAREERKPFALLWESHRAANREEWEARGRVLYSMIRENREAGGSPETRLTLADGKVPADLVSDYRTKLRAELAALNPESIEKQPQVQSAESARLRQIGGTTSAKPKAAAKKLVDRKFQTLSEASAVISAHLNEPKSFPSLAQANEFYSRLVAQQN